MQDRGPLTNILVWVFAAASLIVVSLRLVSRLILTNHRGWDDLFIIIALLLVLLDSCLASYAVSQGLGKHLADLSVQQGVEAAKWAVAADTVAIFVFTVPKAAVAVLLARVLSIAGKTSTFNRLMLYGPAVFMVAFSFTALGVWLGQCHPVEGLWDKTINPQCLDPTIYLGVGIAIGGCSALVDFFYGIYPIFFITRLNMNRRRKWHLSAMLGLQTVGGAVAIWKVTNFPEVSVPNADVTWASSPLVYATLVEANVLICAACVPTLGPLVGYVRRVFFHQQPGKAEQDIKQQPFDIAPRPGDSTDAYTRAFASSKMNEGSNHELQNLRNAEAAMGMMNESAGRSDLENRIVAETVISVESFPRGRSPMRRSFDHAR